MYLKTVVEIQKHAAGFLNETASKFVLRTDSTMVDDFIKQLKQAKLFGRQFLALMLVTGHDIDDKHIKTLKQYYDRNVKLLCEVVNHSISQVKIDACVTNIKTVLDQYQNERVKIKNFLKNHIKSDQISKLYLQFWCQAPLLLNCFTHNQRESLEDMINFIMFFTDNRRHCKQIFNLIYTYVDKNEVAELLPITYLVPDLVPFVTFTSASEVEKICTQIKSLVLVDHHKYDNFMNILMADVPAKPDPIPVPVSKIPVPEAIQEMEITGNEKACTICFEHAINTTIVSCGHQVLCVTCARDYVLNQNKTTCPFCRKEMMCIIWIFNSA